MYLFKDTLADIATPSNAEFSDIVISPDVATDSNAKRYEVNLDGISVIVSAPADAFDREVTLKARRLSKDEIDNNITPEDGDDYIGNTASSNMIETVAAFDESIEETKEVIEETGESVADSEQISENINYLDDAVIGNDESESETYPEDSISLDIHFEDENQLEIEPLTTVYVNIKIDNDMLPPGAKPEDTEVYHIKDDNSITKIEDIALTEDRDDNSITTNFSTDGFSTFTLIWGGNFKVNIKYVDTNGNEIASDLNQLSIYRDHNGYFNNSNDKITPKQLDTGIPGMKYKYARVRMSNGTVVDNVIQIERETSLIKGMRYTVDGTNWVVFGPNEMKFLELVYEPENITNTRRGKVRISKSKTVEDPDKDGIYDLTLEINNLTGSTTDKANLDVLFLVDTSSSMNRRIRVGDDPKMNVVHNSLRRFLNQNYLDSNMYNVNYALVGIDADPTVYQNWTNNKSSIISNYPWAASGQSRINYEKGFVKANELFRNGRSDPLKMLIFLTDGDPTYYTNHNTGHNEGFLIDRYSPMAMLHGQFALYAIDLDYFFSIGLGDTNDYKHLKVLTNSNDNDSPIKG